MDIDKAWQRRSTGLWNEELQVDFAHPVATESQEWRSEEAHWSQQKRISHYNTEKLWFFGHICWMKDARKLNAIVFGVMEGKARKGRPYREWTDDITDWCKQGGPAHAEMEGNRPGWVAEGC